MSADDTTRQRLAKFLDGRGAHLSFDEAVADLAERFVNARAPNVPYTLWHLVEHIRFTQRDILDYLTRDDYHEPRWPDDYWPSPDAETDSAGWQRSIEGFRADLAALRTLVLDPSRDLFATIPTIEVSLFQQIVLVGDHNAYHVGELAILRQVLGAWPAGRAG